MAGPVDIDATWVKRRKAGRIASVAVIVAVGVDAAGRRQALGIKVGPSEAERFGSEFLRRLMRRGLRGVKFVISDSHDGINAAGAKRRSRPTGSAAAFTSRATCRPTPRRRSVA